MKIALKGAMRRKENNGEEWISGLNWIISIAVPNHSFPHACCPGKVLSSFGLGIKALQNSQLAHVRSSERTDVPSPLSRESLHKYKAEFYSTKVPTTPKAAKGDHWSLQQGTSSPGSDWTIHTSNVKSPRKC